MVATFEIEDAVMQLTSSDMKHSVNNHEPVWIALSSGTQCIAGVPGDITHHLDMSALLKHYGMKNYTGYVAQKPWIITMMGELPEFS